MKKVKIFTQNELGDFVICLDCGCMQVVQIGSKICGKCKSKNIDSMDIEFESLDDLTNIGYILE